MRTKTLKWRIINVGIMTIILTLAMIIFIVVFIRQDIKSDVEDHRIALTKNISAQVKSTVELPLKLIEQIDTLIEGDNTLDSRAVSNYMEAILQAHNYFREIHIIDYDGVMVNTAPYNESVIGNSLTNKPYFTNSNEGHILWSEVFISNHTDRPTISATIPEDDYIIVVDLDLEGLPLNFEDFNNFDELDDISIVDQWGTYIYTKDMNDVLLRNTHPLYDVNEPERTIEQDRDTIIFSGIEGFQWYVVYSFNEKAAYRSINRITVFSLFLYMFFSVITLLIIIKHANSTNKSIKVLQQRTDGIIGGDYTFETFDFVHQEIVSLAMDFEVMSHEIQEREEKIKAFNQELEEMVRVRTYQLEETNTQLEEEVEERTKAEATALDINTNLDQIIEMKTFELERVNRQLVANIKAVEEANNAKSQFLAVMSHEMRTPLNGIIGFLQMVDVEVLDQNNKELYEVISSSSQILLSLINNILDVSKFEADKGTFADDIFNAYDLMKKVLEPYSKIAHNKDLEFEVDIDALNHVWMKADSLKLTQLVGNILNNALKFTAVGYIKVNAKCQKVSNGYNLELIIEDSGIGIRDEIKPYLFKPFSQANEKITRDFGGTGLGLTISRNIVEHYKGTIDYSSLYGVGTTFTIKMFIEASDGSVDTIKAATNVIMQAKGDCILVVEDNEVNRKLMVRFLGMNGITCDLAVNGKEAVEAVRQKEYDIIFMDCHMPLMDGIEATRIIRTFNDHVQIYAMTAYASKEDHDRCIQVGMDGFFTKPIDLVELASFLGFEVAKKQESVQISIEEAKKNLATSYAKDLARELGFDMETCVDLIETYIQQAENIFDDIRKFYDSGNAVEVGHKLHQLKGASGAVRLNNHRRLVEKAEKLVKSNRLKESIDLINTLKEDPIFQK